MRSRRRAQLAVLCRLIASLLVLAFGAGGCLAITAGSRVASHSGTATTAASTYAAAVDSSSTTHLGAGVRTHEAKVPVRPSHGSSESLTRARAVFVAAETADVVVPKAWNAATKLPSGGTVRDVGSQIWGNGLPSATRLSGMTDAELRGLASLDDAKMLNAMYRGAQASVPNNATAPIRVQLSQQVIDAWGRK
jgi:hypothetical protein